MLHASVPVQERRTALRQGLDSGKLLRFPGATTPMAATLIQQYGFEGVYVSGGVLANDLSLPDIALTTQTEVAMRAHQIARVVDLPTIVDIDTGFGGPLNAARTIHQLEDLGLSACHIEDQASPKRCGHLDGKTLVDTEEMVSRIRATVHARRDPNFVLIARTDARAVEGLEAAIRRAKAYVEAGADMIFPEALADEQEFERFRRELDVPLLANMTEFGKSQLLDADTLQRLGYNAVIYPVTLQRLAMGAIERGLRALRDEGTQASVVDDMQTRARLYEVLGYDQYNAFTP
ncbi:methylisocitrate lyase [Rhodococcus sp. WS4]|nr:methylisocitrate lyase [Rhodococcus sp. WS4]